MITFVESFKRVGKTTWMLENKDKLKIGDLADTFGLRDNKYGLDYKDSWVFGAFLTHLCRVGAIKEEIMVDRGYLSTIQYGEIQGKDFKAWEYVLGPYLNDLIEIGATIHYFYHADKDSAFKKYETAEKHRIRVDKHDEFESFEDYWEKYEEYNNKAFYILDQLETRGLKVEYTKLGFK